MRRSAQWSSLVLISVVLFLFGWTSFVTAEDRAAQPSVPSSSTAPKVEQSADAVDEKYGKSTEERQGIFRELANAENRADKEATAKFKDNPYSQEQVHLASDLLEKYQLEIAKKHGLTHKQVVDIKAEGFTRKWPVSNP